MYAWLADSLSSSNVVLCASRRLTRELVSAHTDRQSQAGHKVWPTPAIHFIGDWLQGVLDASTSNEIPLRIDNRASTLLWERCILAGGSGELPGFNNTVRQFRQSWSRLLEWCVPLQEVLQRANGPEQRQFAAAAQRYQAILQERGWIDDSGVIEVVCAQVAAGGNEMPEKILLAGYDRISPALQSLIDCLTANGTDVERLENLLSGSSVSVAELPDWQAEQRAAGYWARQQLSRDPALKLAVISPGLETDAIRVSRLVREGFAPGWQYAESAHRLSIDVSYGRSLADYPAIATALLLLRWALGGLVSGDISRLLVSRTIDGGPLGGRSRLELLLRQFPDRLWRPKDLLAVTDGQAAYDDGAGWCRQMQDLVDSAQALQGSHSPADLASRIDELLSAAGWPGAQVQDSSEFQLINRWRELLNEFARLRLVLPTTTFPDAVERISALAADTIFQPEARGVVPVLGVLEAAGMQFDKIWISGFTASRWPSAGNPLMHVSRQLQQDYGMPDATSNDSLEFSRRVLSRLLSGADQVVLSWAASENAIDMQASPLLDELDVAAVNEVLDPGWHAAGMADAGMLEPTAGNLVPPVAADEEVLGGAYTVQRQSTHPFAAFAYGRLGIRELQSIQPGLSASTRGSLIHQALAALYAELPARQEIGSWSDEQIEQRIDKAVDQGINKKIWQADAVLRKIFDLERLRMRSILRQFVDAEKQRDEFTVAHVEYELTYTNSSISLDLRVDRIDQLADGRISIIDYKTGAEKSLANRYGDIIDLQLMVYALAYDGTVGGLAIINVDSRKISYRKTDSDENWPEKYAEWRSLVEQAMEGLSSGDARVNIALNSDQARPVNVLCRFEELRSGR